MCELPKLPAANFLKFLLLCSLPVIPATHSLLAQGPIPAGTWRTHFSYYTGQLLTSGDKKIYAATANGLFSLDLENNTLQVLSKANDLSGTGTSALNYNTEFNMLVVGYQTGNIDLLTATEAINVRTILNAQRENKTINHINFVGQSAYLSTGFGLARLNLQTFNIQETYENIAPGGRPVQVFTSVVYNDSLFIASDAGLLAASLSPQVNRLDFNNWRRVSTPSIFNIRQLAVYENSLFYNIAGTLYRYRNGDSEMLPVPVADGNILHLNTGNGQLLMVKGGQVFSSDSTLLFQAVSADLLQNPRQVLTTGNGDYWVADNCAGLVKVDQGQAQAFRPEGILYPVVQKLQSFDGRIVALPGGFTPQGNPFNRAAAFGVFENGQWKNYAAPSACFTGTVPLPEVEDLSAFAWLTGQQQAYLGSFGGGLLRWDVQTDAFELVSSAPFSGQAARITSLSSGLADGSLWVTLFTPAAGLSPVYLLEEGNWRGFNLAGSANQYPIKILPGFFGPVWLQVSPGFSGGLFVFDETAERYLAEGPGNGDLPDRRVNALVQDLTGSIWAGTDQGVAEFFDQVATLQGQAESVTPIFENNRLLRDEQVTALAVDGGNRKWMGSSSGLWLFSDNGTELVSFFDSRNSPLPSNNILDIAIENQTGEVFIATDQGLVSYRGTATAATGTHENVKVFPNPVRPDFNGLISIEGLAYNATVKITDANGRLVHQTRANGGTAVWNGFDYTGQRASTGIYLVFSVSEESFSETDSFVGKFAIVK